MKVFIADPHHLTLEGIRRTLERSSWVEVVGQAVTASELLARIERAQPDVVLVELDVPDDPMGCVNHIRERHPHITVVMLSAEHDPGRIEMALTAGAAACVLKSVHPDDLAPALRQAMDRTFYSAVVTAPSDQPPGSKLDAGLTSREQAVLDAVARGLSNKEIGSEMWVTEQTVKFHLNNLYRKLGVPNRTAAARYAFDRGFGDPLP